MSKLGTRIIEGLKEAARGNFARVTIEGQTWVRLDRGQVVVAENPHSHHTNGPIDEDAYRRGYQQGAYHALRAVDAAVSNHQLSRWEKAIVRWRFKVTHKSRIPAPEINCQAGRVVEFDRPPKK
jgi:hypothetical protein